MNSILSFGLWLKQRRRILDMTQHELAERIGCSVQTIRKIEADERRPSKQVAERLAEHLSIPASDRGVFLQCARAEICTDRLTLISRPLNLAFKERGIAMPIAQVGDAALFKRPIETAPALPSGTVTFLFADIEDSTALWEQHPQTMGATISLYMALLRHAIVAHDGVEFKTLGDLLCVAFASAPAALAAALATQRALHAEPWDTRSPLRVRIALHTGTSEVSDGDYIGLAINRVVHLLAAGHGGQTLLSRTTQELARDHLPPGTTLRDLGTQQLQELTRPEQIFQLVAPGLPTSFPPLKKLERRPTHLPAPAALIGRAHEVAAVCEMLRTPQVRLVALTGLGGTGKTRLGLQVAAELIDEFANGVFFVALAPLGDPGLVAAAIAQALCIGDTDGRPIADRLKSYLHNKQMLLLIDNVDQAAPAAPLIAALLAAAPRLKVLVTGQATLGLQGEQEFPVSALALPNPRFLPDSATLARYPAVELFIQRALAVKPDFQITPTNAPAVAEICIRLDGLPLAIELAAARSKLLSPQAMLARLDSRIDSPPQGARDLPARQQTLRKTIEWSYALLSESEQKLFARLAVFVGGCALDAVEAVCKGGGARSEARTPDRRRASTMPLLPSILSGLESLLDKSLLRQEIGADGEPRFVMLETIRQYALERLEERRESEALRRRHAEHYLALAEAAEPELWDMRQGLGIDRLAVEHDNLRAALEWGMSSDIALRLAGALWWFWGAHGYLNEGRSWTARALAQTTEPTVARAKALLGAGFLANFQGDYAEARALIEESLAISRVLEDQRGMAYALIFLGLVIMSQGDSAPAAPLIEEGLALCLRMDDKPGTAWALYYLGTAALEQGSYVEAQKLYEESLTLRQEAEDRRGIAECLEGLAGVAALQGQSARAAQLCGTAETLYKTIMAAQPQVGRSHYERTLTIARTSLGEDRFAAAWAVGGAIPVEQVVADILDQRAANDTTIA